MLLIKPDNHILLVGGGSIGSMFVFYLTSCLRCRYVAVSEKIGRRAQNLKDCFGINISVEENIPYDLVIDCSNDPDGTLQALHAAKPGGSICIMSHLYGLDTSFIYEEICRKELRPCFPLRNGQPKNLRQAISCIAEYWDPFFDQLIHVYDDLNTAFAEKEHSPWNKHVVKMFRENATEQGVRSID
jgi:L-iditol 2-dehydrogenase